MNVFSKRGFTLVEVLVALTVLTISMVGIYGILKQSAFSTANSVKRSLLADLAYERIVISVRYPELAAKYEETVDGMHVFYSEKREPVLFSMVNKVTLQTRTADALVVYEYFEKIK